MPQPETKAEREGKQILVASQGRGKKGKAGTKEKG